MIVAGIKKQVPKSDYDTDQQQLRRTRLEFTFLHFCQISNPIDYIHSNERKHDIDG